MLADRSTCQNPQSPSHAAGEFAAITQKSGNDCGSTADDHLRVWITLCIRSAGRATLWAGGYVSVLVWCMRTSYLVSRRIPV